MLLAGCASLQQPQDRAAIDEPPTAPADWIAATGTPAMSPEALSGWWRRFDDPTLTGLVERALERNPDVRTAAAAWRQARALRDADAAATAPVLGGAGGLQASRREGQPSSRQANLGFEASWEADLGGRLSRSVDAAQAEADAAASTLGQVRVALAAEVAASWLELRGAEARLAIAGDSLASQERSLQIARWREMAGLVNRLDVEQAVSAVEQTRAQIPALRSTIAQRRHALAVLCGDAPGRSPAVPGVAGATAPVTPPASPPTLALAFPADVLRQRPDIAAAEADVRAAAARVDVADAQRLPRFTLGGSIGLSALTLGGLGPGAGLASLAASVDLPLLDGGARVAQVRVQEAVLDGARSRWRAAVLAALQEVEDVLVGLAGTRSQLQSLQAAAAAARAAARGAEDRYAAGLVDFSTVLDTQRTQLQLDDTVANAATTLALQHVQLYKALGGGWSPDAEATPTSMTATRAPTVTR